MEIQAGFMSFHETNQVKYKALHALIIAVKGMIKNNSTHQQSRGRKSIFPRIKTKRITMALINMENNSI